MDFKKDWIQTGCNEILKYQHRQMDDTNSRVDFVTFETLDKLMGLGDNKKLELVIN